MPRSARVAVEAGKTLGGHAATIERRQEIHREDRAQRRRRESPAGDADPSGNGDDPPETPESPGELDVLHEGLRWKSAGPFERFPPHEDRLVAVWEPAPARAHVRNPEK